MEPIINSQVPEFKVQAFHNGEFKTVTNKDIEGKWAIFFFYPADFTFVCPTELVDIAEKYNQFKEMGVEVYSVSTDSHFVHKAWHDASETRFCSASSFSSYFCSSAMAFGSTT